METFNEREGVGEGEGGREKVKGVVSDFQKTSYFYSNILISAESYEDDVDSPSQDVRGLLTFKIQLSTNCTKRPLQCFFLWKT